ncbi:MAG: hypothetical protein JWM88_400 [Verrucomicrobia bacterium]|nr:hypothetical protein [Verrucomicrobiota bacterium]
MQKFAAGMPSLSASSRLRLIPILLSQGIGLGCGLAAVKLNSHLIPPATLGFYGVFLTFAPMGMWVVHAGLLKFVGRNWAAANDRPGMTHEILAAWTRRLVWLVLLALGAGIAMARTTDISPLLIGTALFISAALLSLGALAQSALQAERAHWRDCAVAASGSLSRSFLPPLLYAAANGAAVALLAGFTVHALIMAAAGAWALGGIIVAGVGKKIPARTLTAVYEGPLFVALTLALWTLTGVNRWIVAWFFGDIEAGYFTLAGGAAMIVASMLGTAAMQYVQPGLFALGDGPETARSTLARRVDLVALAYTVVALGALAVITAFASRLVGPLISVKYVEALKWLLPAGCFGVATLVAAYYHTMLLAGRRERACAPVDLSTAAVLVIGCLGAAKLGSGWLARWLLVSPVVPWILTRTLARHYFFKPDPHPARAPAQTGTSA